MSNHSLYSDVQDTSPTTQTLEAIFQVIRSEQHKDKINAIRNAKGDQKDSLKKTLPGFTASGVFGGRRIPPNLQNHTGIIGLDFDKIDSAELAVAKEKLKQKDWILGFFTSPSGNGLKVFVKTDCNQHTHVFAYKCIKDRVEEVVGLKADESCKDITRLCFLSYDSKAYFNPKAGQLKIFSDKTTNAWVETQSQYPNEEGSRNNLVFTFALMCKLKNIDINECREYSKLMCDLPQEETIRTVKSAYKGDYWAMANNMSSKGGKYGPLEQFLSTQYRVRFNVITNKPEVLINGDYNPLTDLVFNDILRSASEARVPVSEKSLRVVLYSGFATRHNPYDDYFQNLPEWDGFDYLQELVDLIPFREPAQAIFYLRRWMIGLVACLSDEQKVNQHMLVLVGAQGIGKTTFFNSVVPEELKKYVFHGVIRPDDKDTIALLADKMLIVVDELDTMRPNQLHMMKEIITKPQITIRRPYARTSDNLPRRATFAASVNNADFLVDPTGNRRYLCLYVDGDIPHGLNIDLEQLFSQVQELYRSGESYWFTKDEIAAIEEANQDFIQPSAEEELLLQTFRPPHEDDPYKKLSATEVSVEVCNKFEYPVGRISPVAMGKMLSKNGFPAVKVNGRKKYKVRRLV